MRLLVILSFITALLFAKNVTVKQLFNVQTVKVKKVQAAQNRKYYGYVTADDSQKVAVTPRFGGFIVELYADKIYEQVKKGELLARVYSPKVLRAEEEFLNTLHYNKKIPSPALLKSAKEKLQLLGVDAAEIEKIEKTLQVSRYTNIYAPTDGYIFAKSIIKGAAFASGQQLFEIVSLKDVWVEAALYPQDIPLLAKFAQFSVESPVGTFTAQKEMLYPKLEKKDAPLTLRLKVGNKNNALLVGMYVTITAASKDNSYLTLPATAVIFKNGGYYVFKAGEYEGEYDPVSVHVKELDAKTYIVTGDLKERDTVVDNALFMIDSDAQINGLY